MTSHLQLNIKTKHAAQVSKRSHALAACPTLTKDDVKLSRKALSKTQQEQAWTKIHDYLYAYRDMMLGYQTAQNFSDVLKDFSDLHINNAGDPFTQGTFRVNTKALECAVLDYFAKLWHIDLLDLVDDEEKREEAYWGYIVSMGCTEANLYALYNARDYLSGESLLYRSDIQEKSNVKPACQADTTRGKCPHGLESNPKAFTPVAFFSESAHYSLTKALRILKINSFYEFGSGHFPCPLTHPEDYPSDYSVHFLDQNGWPRLVPVNADGSMHVPSLVKLVGTFASIGHPPIVIFTCGSPFRGSFDNPRAAIDKLMPVLKQYGLYERHVHGKREDPTQFDVRRGFWFHCDGALGASYLPFLEMSINEGAFENDFPNGFPVFDFRIPEMMSISTSLHKWLGCPFPSGVYMTKRKYQLKPPSNPHYIASGDTTLAGSRNAHSAISMWDLFSRKSYEDLADEAVRSAHVAEFAKKLLQDLEKDLAEDLWLSHSPGSLFICFKKPNEDIVLKYSLASNVYLVENKRGQLERKFFAHICLMSHVDRELIEKFVEDLRQPGAFPNQDSQLT